MRNKLIRFSYPPLIAIQLLIAFDGAVDWLNWLAIGWTLGLWAGIEIFTLINERRNLIPEKYEVKDRD